jgi:hypothetical protein
MGMEVNLRCPQCGERVPDIATYAAGDDVRQQRATCPQCHVELVRHPDLEDNAWKVETPPSLSEEELGGGD